jgi:hypothetical protein
VRVAFASTGRTQGQTVFTELDHFPPTGSKDAEIDAANIRFRCERMRTFDPQRPFRLAGHQRPLLRCFGRQQPLTNKSATIAERAWDVAPGLQVFRVCLANARGIGRPLFLT